MFLTMPYCTPKKIQYQVEEVVFEMHGFRGLSCVPSGEMVLQGEGGSSSVGRVTACLVVEAGFSFTHLIPCIQGGRARIMME